MFPRQASVLECLTVVAQLSPVVATGVVILLAVGEAAVLLLGTGALVTGAVVGLGLSAQTATRWRKLTSMRTIPAVLPVDPSISSFRSKSTSLSKGMNEQVCAESAARAYSLHQEVVMHTPDEVLVARWKDGDGKALDEL